MEMGLGLYYDLIRVLGEVSVLRQKVLNFHWNVVGEDFYQRHLLFERVYGMLDAFVDRVAENVRKYGRAPGTFKVYLDVSAIKEEDAMYTGGEMIGILLRDFRILEGTLIQTNESAEKARDIGVMNLIGDLAETVNTITYLLKSNGM